MTNNDILRRIRYVFDLNDKKMMKIFELAGATTTRATISDWLKQEDAEGYVNCPDLQLATFLNGFIVFKRGPSEQGVPAPEKKLNNNIIFRKLKIALKLDSDQVIELLLLSDFRLGKSELSAFFRKPDHKHYRDCKDQILRNFIFGLQEKYRPKEAE
ncbi:MAG: DUF1456 family protein [Sinobacterium sp.]|nr:DUF1456 family protein [Sinobacterium sp.]